MVKQLSRSNAGKGAVEAGLCCPTAHITELTLLIAFLSQLHAAARVCPTRTADLGGGKSSQNSPACSSHTAKSMTAPEPGQHPTLYLHTPTFAAGAPDQVLPQAMGSCHIAIHTQGSSELTTAPWDPGLGKTQEKGEIAPAVWFVLQQQEFPGGLHWLR